MHDASCERITIIHPMKLPPKQICCGGMAEDLQVSMLGFRDPGASVRADEIQLLHVRPHLRIEARVCGSVL